MKRWFKQFLNILVPSCSMRFPVWSQVVVIQDLHGHVFGSAGPWGWMAALRLFVATCNLGPVGLEICNQNHAVVKATWLMWFALICTNVHQCFFLKVSHLNEIITPIIFLMYWATPFLKHYRPICPATIPAGVIENLFGQSAWWEFWLRWNTKFKNGYWLVAKTQIVKSKVSMVKLKL